MSSDTLSLPFVKGHGTRNDFVVLPDLDGTLELTPELARAVCDRRAGVGGDGVLRVVRSVAAPEAPSGAEWFMDYRNADGSSARMCGNGLRVFARHLVDSGLCAPGELRIGTRAGVRVVWLDRDGDITVDMGRPERIEASPTVNGVGGTAVSMGNPHVVVPVGSAAELAALDLATAPVVEPPLPDGQNVEFVWRSGRRRLVMRVHERGAGETWSCGTGVCAVAVATSWADGTDRDGSWTVEVPGGELLVECSTGSVLLTGPAVLVAEGEIRADALSR